MKKFSKSGPPARAERSERPARKPSAGAAPRRSHAPRDGEAPRRSYAARGSDGGRGAYGPRGGAAPPPRRSYARAGEEAAAAPRSAYGDPYQRAQRPPRGSEGGEGGDAGRRPAGRGFTVTLDPDVARVFRGDASVNKALRLVLQLMQVVEGPGPRAERPASRPRSAYQGSDEARGFARKPRFVEEDGDD